MKPEKNSVWIIPENYGLIIDRIDENNKIIEGILKEGIHGLKKKNENYSG